MKHLMTTDQFAAAIGVSPITVRRWQWDKRRQTKRRPKATKVARMGLILYWYAPKQVKAWKALWK